MTGFVPASSLYDVETRSTRRHPAHQATDIEVRKAIKKDEERELVTDGGARVPGASYRVDCWSCGKQIAASARYCPGCGEVQLQGEEDPSIVTDGGTCGDSTDRIGDAEIIPREELEQTAEDEYGPRYRCPRCGYKYVTEYCDCPECLWAGMCQEGWE